VCYDDGIVGFGRGGAAGDCWNGDDGTESSSETVKWNSSDFSPSSRSGGWEDFLKVHLISLYMVPLIL